MHEDTFLQIKETGRDGLQARVEHIMRESHQPYFHDNTSLWNNAGMLDLWVPRTGYLEIVELKAMKGKLSAEQKVWIEALEQCQSVRVRVLRPDEYEAYRDDLWDDWIRRMNAGGTDPITRLAATIRGERMKRKVQAKARKSGQIPLAGKGRRWRVSRTGNG